MQICTTIVCSICHVNFIIYFLAHLHVTIPHWASPFYSRAIFRMSEFQRKAYLEAGFQFCFFFFLFFLSLYNFIPFQHVTSIVVCLLSACLSSLLSICTNHFQRCVFLLWKLGCMRQYMDDDYFATVLLPTCNM